MGLTVYYTLRHRAPLSDEAPRSLVGDLRAVLLESGVPGVSHLMHVGPDFPCAHEWLELPRSDGRSVHVDVSPETGHLFWVNVGRDCEPLLLGLCRFPATVVHRGRTLRTRRPHCWRLQYFCKTQFASLHGWEHFLSCHRVVVESLLIARRLGFELRIRDEGGYWPRRSETTLRRRLDEMNGIVAAMSGALKDAADDSTVQSPIFRNPNFEHLEHEGARALGPRVQKVARIIRRTAQRQNLAGGTGPK